MAGTLFCYDCGDSGRVYGQTGTYIGPCICQREPAEPVALSQSADSQRLDWLLQALPAEVLETLGVTAPSGFLEIARQDIDKARLAGRRPAARKARAARRQSA